MQTIEHVLENTAQLPPAPQVLGELLTVLSDLEADTGRVVDLITFDPGLTAKLLQTSNSALLGRGKPIDDVADAVNRLGFQTVYRIVASASAGQILRPGKGTYGVNPEGFWKHSVMTAFAAQIIARDSTEDANLLFTAGLLHDVGRVILANAFKEGYADVVAKSGKGTAEAVALEKATYGLNHAEVGARLLARWKFSAPIISAVWFHHSPAAAGPMQRFAACVNLADALAHSIDASGPVDLNGRPGHDVALKTLERTVDDLAGYQGQILENMQFVEALCR
jgi:putative nucleotidyltransferase with HDIG domain